MKRFLDELEVGIDSIDSIFINLIIYINKDDVESFQYAVKKIIQDNLFKNKFCKEILICLSMSVNKKTQIGFYQPMIDLLDKYFKVFNFKYLLKAKISIINSDFVNLYKIVDQLHKKNYVDAQNIKNNIIIHLINNDFKPILFKYLHCKYDNFITKITKIHYKIKIEKYDDALNLLNTLECTSDSELYRKNIISFKLAKCLGNFDLCHNIIDSLKLDNKKNTDLQKKILSFLS
jgi:ribosomal protein L22